MMMRCPKGKGCRIHGMCEHRKDHEYMKGMCDEDLRSCPACLPVIEPEAKPECNRLEAGCRLEQTCINPSYCKDFKPVQPSPVLLSDEEIQNLHMPCESEDCKTRPADCHLCDGKIVAEAQALKSASHYQGEIKRLFEELQIAIGDTSFHQDYHKLAQAIQALQPEFLKEVGNG